MPDMLSVGQGKQSHSQYRAQMLLWSVMGAPLILGADIRKLDTFYMSLITAKEVLAVNADADVVQGSRLRAHESYEVWGKPISQRVDKPKGAGNMTEPALVAVLFNKGSVNATTVAVQVAAAGGDHGNSDFYPAQISGRFAVRDLLLQKDLGVFRGSYSQLVPPQDAVMIQITPA